MNTKQQRESAVEYPKWLDDVFILYLSNYGRLWLETMPDKRSEHMKRLNWMEALQNFKPETIMRAAKQARLDSETFPPSVGHIFKLCEEFSKTNRYIETQIEHQEPVFVDGKRVGSEKSEEFFKKMRKELGYRRDDAS